MPLYRKILVVLLIGIIVFFASVYWFVAFQAPRLVKDRFERATGKTITIGSVRPFFPDRLICDEITISGELHIPRTLVVVDSLALLTGKLRIAEVSLLLPEIKVALPVELAAEGDIEPAKEKLANPLAEPVNAKKNVDAAINLVRIVRGVVVAQDAARTKTWVLDNVQAEIKNFPLSGVAVKTNFIVEASLARMNLPFVGHKARASGWVNWAARDMDASVQVLDESGRAGLSAVLTSRNNDCEVKGKVKLSSGQSAQSSGKKAKMVEAAVLELLSSLQTNIEANFSFRTRLDRFQVGKVNISGNITTGLHSDALSGNIVGGLKSAGSKMMEKDVVTDAVTNQTK